MKIKTLFLQEITRKVVQALDTDVTSSATGDKVELLYKDGKLTLNVTNQEYYVRTLIPDVETEEFRAVVDARLFTNLINLITVEDIELIASSSALVIKGQGINYTLPYSLVGNNLPIIEEITIDETKPQYTFTIPAQVLLSIDTYNSKELSFGTPKNPLQRIYYLDEKGCITFNGGICINKFDLPTPFKILLPKKFVKLFKLFKNGDIQATIGTTTRRRETVTVFKLATPDVVITTLTPTSENLLKSYPHKQARERATNPLNYVVEVNREELTRALSRLVLTSSITENKKFKDIGYITFTDGAITITDFKKINREIISCTSCGVEKPVQLCMELPVLKSIAETCVEDGLSISFGNNVSITITRGNIINVVTAVVPQNDEEEVSE